MACLDQYGYANARFEHKYLFKRHHTSRLDSLTTTKDHYLYEKDYLLSYCLML